METYYKQFDSCRQWESPPCTSVCPFHMDVLDFQKKMADKRYNAAYKTFHGAVGFPLVISRLCPKSCANVCPRKDVDAAVQLNLMEKTCVEKATRKDPPVYNLPAKKERVGIIGGGMSGLACALRLASKKYQVTVFEKTDRLGGRIKGLMQEAALEEEIRGQFQNESCEFRLNSEITDADELKEENFDAIYVATGPNGEDFGALSIEGDRNKTADTKFFAGGGLTGKDAISAIADGLDIAWSIEVYLKTGKKEYPPERNLSGVVIDSGKLEKTDPVIPTATSANSSLSGDDSTYEGFVFTDEETEAEAERCIRCQCDACRRHCDLSSFTGKWPLKMRDEIMTTVMASESMIHKTPAVRLLNMCTQCKLCDEVCPEHIQLGDMIREARHRLHSQNKMPGAYHRFWLNDMGFSNSEYAMIAKSAPGRKSCAYAFFPGCHLGAANPEYVTLPYRMLLSQDPATGLLLRCCGIPADWAGNEEMHESELSALRKDWALLGKPTLIMACPSCERHFAEYLPEITTISLYELLCQRGQAVQSPQIAQAVQSQNQRRYSVFDPCAARNRKGIQQGVRNLAETNGMQLEELPEFDKHGCCGFGGNISAANQDFADYVGKMRSNLSENPYIVYCINCREAFQHAGKESIHILDAIFGVNPDDHPMPDFTERRGNRILLKETLLKEIWGEEMPLHAEAPEFELIMSAEIREKMNRLMLLKEDIHSVLALSLSSKRRTFNQDRGTYLCYRELGHITCWIEYRPKGDAFEIMNIYTHRMKIEIEAIWNGKKTDVAK